MPMGGQAGASFEMRVTGQDLTAVEGLHFSFAGAKAESLGSEATPVDPKIKGKGQPPTGLSTSRFKVTLPANAPTGIQDVRIVTKSGVSNPRAFVVGDHKEFTELEPNDDVPKAQKIELNSSVSGVITTQTDVDYYAFAGKKGQRVVCSCLTTSIDSRLPAFVEVYSSTGAKIGSGRNHFHNDALVDVTLPDDGDYYVRVCSFSYTVAGIDYFYRLTVTTAPWVDAVFPPVVEPGKDAQVTVYGRNLPGGKLDPTFVVNDRSLEKTTVNIEPTGDAKAAHRLAFPGFVPPIASLLDGFDYRMKSAAGVSNPYLIQYSTVPVVVDAGNNDQQGKAQQIPAPCVIAGRIDTRGDKDWYAFSAKKGQVFHIEAFSERLGAPMDLIFQVRNAQGTVITEQDDTAEILSPQFYTGSTDPARYRFVATADEIYYLMVTARDAYTQFGPRHIYTVKITPEEPDFRLVAMPVSTLAPDANTIHQSGGAAFAVYVWRFGGFNGDITLVGDNLPPGVGMQPQVIPGSQKVGNFVVHADAGAQSWTGAINVVGTADAKGQKLVREVRSATMSWPVIQQNVPSITRLDRELVVAVRDKAPYTLAVEKPRITLQQGEKISIPVKLVPGENFKTNVTVNAIGGPPGLIAPAITLTPTAPGGNATLDIKGGMAIPPGNYTVFVRGQTNPINPKNPQPPKGGAPPNIVQTSMPVIVTIVPKQLGKLTATPTNAKVMPGKDVEISVRFARQFEVASNLKIEAIMPPNVKGLSAKIVQLKAEDEETKLTINVSPEAPPGQQSITIRATAMFNDTIPVVHEAKVTLNVGK
jgi:hypothetical protein